MLPDAKPGKLLILTAPSGAGKTTIANHLLDTFDELAFSVSATTRAPRPGEVDGRNYHFLGQDEFMWRVDNGEFIEYEEVYPGGYYGTLRSELERIWSNDQTVVFDIEVKGATNIKRMFPDDSLAIFISPPSPEILFERLRARGSEDDTSLKARIARAHEELKYTNTFDRVLVNDDLETALAEAERMVRDFLG